MPITSLSKRALEFPEIGRIRKGMKVPTKDGKSERPLDLKYFRVTFDPVETDAAAWFKQQYGEQPIAIRIFLPFNEIDRLWDYWLEAYTAGRLICRSDGDKIIFLTDGQTGEPLVRDGIDKNGLVAPYTEGMVVSHDRNGKPITCKPRGRLKVMLPGLDRVAYLTVITGSWADCANITAQLGALAEVNGGRLAGIPLLLCRKPRQVSCPSPSDPTQRVRMEKWLLSIEADPAWVKLMMAHKNQLARPEIATMLLPPEIGNVESPVTESSSDDEELGEDNAETSGTEKQAEIPPAEAKAEKSAETPKAAANEKKTATPVKPLNVRDTLAEINRLGSQLWPGMWPERKAAIDKQFTAGGKVDLAKVQEFLSRRLEAIGTDWEAFAGHVNKSWPDWGDAPAQVMAALNSDKFSRTEFLAGLQKAVSASRADSKLTREQAITIILAELSESQIPVEF